MPKITYSCIVFLESGETKKWKYVRDLKSFSNFLSKSHPSWKYFNVYEKSSRSFLKRFYVGNFIPKVLSFVLLLILSSTLNFKPLKNTFNKTTFEKQPSKNCFASFIISLKGGAEC